MRLLASLLPGSPAIVGAQNYAGFLEPVFETADYLWRHTWSVLPE